MLTTLYGLYDGPRDRRVGTSLRRKERRLDRVDRVQHHRSKNFVCVSAGWTPHRLEPPPISPYLPARLPAADTTKPSGSAPAESDPSAPGCRLVARSLLLAERDRPDKPSVDRQISPRESALSPHYAAWAPARDIAGLHGNTGRNSCNQTASVRNALECDRTCRAVGGVRYPQNDSGGNRAACLAFRPLTS